MAGAGRASKLLPQEQCSSGCGGRRQAAPISIPQSIAPLPDLSESAIATTRSEDEWFALASRLQQQGELRLAVRAAYLGFAGGIGATRMADDSP